MEQREDSDRSVVHLGSTRRTRRAQASRYANRSIRRALALLDCFTVETPALSLQELSQRLRLHRSTVHRIALNLIETGYLRYDGRGQYQLGLRLFELGAVVLRGIQLVGTARPVMERLSSVTGETSHLAILDNGEVLYLETIEGTKPLRMSGMRGCRRPAHATALGKCLLAHLPRGELQRIVQTKGLPRYTERTIANEARLEEELERIRTLGYAFDDEELEVGLRCLAAPIHDFSGRVTAAVAISAPAFRLTDDVLPTWASFVVGCAHEISGKVGGRAKVSWPGT